MTYAGNGMDDWLQGSLSAAGTLASVSATGADVRPGPARFEISRADGLHGDRQFYVIWRQRSAGFFSIVSTILGHIRQAERLGAIPVLDMRTFPNRYSDPNPGSEAGWDCYFRQLTDVPLSELRQASRLLVTDGSHPRDTTMFVSEDAELRTLWHAWMQLADEASAFVSGALELSHVDAGTLAVHVRLGDMRTAKAHPLPPTVGQLLGLAQHAVHVHGFREVLVCTAEEGVADVFQRSLQVPVRTVSYPAGRIEVRQGMQVLADAHVMASAGGLISGTSNVSEASFLMRNEEPAYSVRIWNGWNSNRPLVPRFEWKARAAAPAWLGGFPTVACPVCEGPQRSIRERGARCA